MPKQAANFIGEGTYADFPVAADTFIGMGNLVALDANGYAKVLTADANLPFAGVAVTSADNTGGANGAKTVTVRRTGTVEIDTAGTTFTQADVGKVVYGDFNIATGASVVTKDGTNRTAVGSIVAVLGNRARIDIRRFTF